MDWVQSAVTSASSALIVLAGIAARSLVRRGRDEKRDETVDKTLDFHGRRLDEHDDRFEKLDIRFIPRPELQETMKDIRRSQDRQERMLEALILPRVRPIGTDSENGG